MKLKDTLKQIVKREINKQNKAYFLGNKTIKQKENIKTKTFKKLSE